MPVFATCTPGNFIAVILCFFIFSFRYCSYRDGNGSIIAMFKTKYSPWMRFLNFKEKCGWLLECRSKIHDIYVLLHLFFFFCWEASIKHSYASDSNKFSFRYYAPILPSLYQYYMYIHHIVIYEDFADEATSTQLFGVFLVCISCAYLFSFTTFIAIGTTHFL